MEWNEILDTCAKDYVQHLNGLKQSLDTLNADKAMALGGQYTEQNCPDNVKDKIDRDKKSWQKEWVMYGSPIQEMTQKHQKQVYTLMQKQEIVNDLAAANEQGKEKSKQNGRGR